MGLINNIGKTISGASQDVIQKGKGMASVAKYNSMVSEEEKKLARIYEQLGRKYAEVHGDHPEDLFKEYFEALDESNKNIKEYQEKIVEQKGIIKCPHCGAEVPNGSLFCMACGSKIVSEQDKKRPEERHCSACGAVVPFGNNFCTSCGKPIGTENISESKEGDD